MESESSLVNLNSSIKFEFKKKILIRIKKKKKTFLHIKLLGKRIQVKIDFDNIMRT